MMNTIIGNEREIIKLLRAAGCCLRCCLRFIGSRETNYYDDPLLALEKLEYLDKSDIVNTPCTVCLGILQDELFQSAIQKTSEEIIRGNYDCDTFTIALTIPVLILLRERSLQIYLAQSLKLSDEALRELKLQTQSIKEIWKLLAVPKIEDLTNKIGEPQKVTSVFLVDIFFSHSRDEEECVALLKKCNVERKSGNSRHKYREISYSRKNVESTLDTLNDDQFVDNCTIPPTTIETFATIDKVNCAHSSLFIGGRYNKLSRNLCQTPWFINGERKMETSVQEILCEPILKYVQADSMKFLSSGREDVDVRMLNNGRPFAVELINPRRTKFPEGFEKLVTDINKTSEIVQITSNLKLLSKLDLKKLKEGENEKTKNYRAFCICKPNENTVDLINKLNDVKNMEIVQKTPIRVLHRRPLASRIRMIHSIRAQLIKSEELEKFSVELKNLEGNELFFVDVKTQAGTYVKEFVHSDFGRTVPSLCSLLQTDVDIIALDVTGINLNWP